MIYVLYGENDYLINEEINKIVTCESITKISYCDYSIEKIIRECKTRSLFSEQKSIVVYNSDFLTSQGKISTDDIDKLIDYMNKPNENCILILTVLSADLDNRKKLVKELKAKYRVLKFDNYSEKELFNYIYNSFKNEGYKIENNTINLMVGKLNNNLYYINNEITKLKIYKLTEHIISNEDVIACITDLYDEVIFKFIDEMLEKKHTIIYTMYDEYFKDREDPIKLLNLIFNQLKLIYQVSVLSKINTGIEIAKLLNIHPYRVEIALRKLSGYNLVILKQTLLKVSSIDANIKKGYIDKNHAFLDYLLTI